MYNLSMPHLCSYRLARWGAKTHPTIPSRRPCPAPMMLTTLYRQTPAYLRFTFALPPLSERAATKTIHRPMIDKIGLAAHHFPALASDLARKQPPKIMALRPESRAGTLGLPPRLKMQDFLPKGGRNYRPTPRPSHLMRPFAAIVVAVRPRAGTCGANEPQAIISLQSQNGTPLPPKHMPEHFATAGDRLWGEKSNTTFNKNHQKMTFTPHPLSAVGSANPIGLRPSCFSIPHRSRIGYAFIRLCHGSFRPRR